ncbi:hypothetical protein [Roseibium sp. MMSF_3412]|uniref:hypothetical protein n=1 Tax=Roseibium sp. MMSF_3412 TaxID=3046712 RepID=UPI0027401B4F|nr:hypothetical protein [Roseibium sp. MMSF_3412]
MITIVNEALEHFSAREVLLDQSFGEDRHLKTCERLDWHTVFGQLQTVHDSGVPCTN